MQSTMMNSSRTAHVPSSSVDDDRGELAERAHPFQDADRALVALRDRDGLVDHLRTLLLERRPVSVATCASSVGDVLLDRGQLRGFGRDRVCLRVRVGLGAQPVAVRSDALVAGAGPGRMRRRTPGAPGC